MKKLAIIGASYGQKKLCETAAKMNIYTIGFAWEEGAVCKDLFSKFYPISITETDKILEICRKEKIDGIVSNGSDYTAKITTYLSAELGLNGNDYDMFTKTQNKFWTRILTNSIEGLSPIKAELLQNKDTNFSFPCILKPCVGGSKKGVSFIESEKDLNTAIEYAKEFNDEIMLEEYVKGREISVETLSYKNKHIIIQITDKDVSGAPHFVELGHHEPAILSKNINDKIHSIVPKILDAIHYKNGATHIEFKIDDNDNIYLIEINQRGGGDEISNKLIQLSTDFDFTKALIEIALDEFEFPSKIENKNYAGIYYLCSQTKDKLKFFTNPAKSVIECKVFSQKLTESKTNYDRNGYLIYCDSKKLILE